MENWLAKGGFQRRDLLLLTFLLPNLPLLGVTTVNMQQFYWLDQFNLFFHTVSATFY